MLKSAIFSVLVTLFTVLSPVSGRQAHVLTDENFEHDTQATTGSTTGDWLILFCEDRYVKCREMHEEWNQLSGVLFGKINVAYVNV
jgi:hypothetical protein